MEGINIYLTCHLLPKQIHYLHCQNILSRIKGDKIGYSVLINIRIILNIFHIT